MSRHRDIRRQALAGDDDDDIDDEEGGYDETVDPSPTTSQYMVDRLAAHNNSAVIFKAPTNKLNGRDDAEAEYEDYAEDDAFDDYHPTHDSHRSAPVAIVKQSLSAKAAARAKFNAQRPAITTAALPPQRPQRSAADEAKTLAAVESLRLEKVSAAGAMTPKSTANASPNAATSLTRTKSADFGSMNTAAVSSATVVTEQQKYKPLSTKQQKEKASLLATAIAASESKPVLSLVVIGHVDAGKSTLMGHLLVKLDVVSMKTIRKYEKESRERGKASFHFAWVLDEQEEERSRGITVDVAVSGFETASKRITLLDAPGHRDFIPNMISGASAADAAVLVVPAVRGEFEGGFSDGGQTREHSILARALGVTQIIVAINKMEVVEWSQERFDEISAIIVPFLRTAGFRANNIALVPVSGLTGQNLISRDEPRLSSWYNGATLIELIDRLSLPERAVDRPFRLAITDVFRSPSLGITVAGRVESGSVMLKEQTLLLPTNEIVTVKGIECGGAGQSIAIAGQNVELGIFPPSDAAILTIGQWLCDPTKPIPLVTHFVAHIVTMSIKIPLLSGSQLILYYQSTSEEVVCSKLIAVLDKSNGAVIKARPRAIGKQVSAEVELTCKRGICLELYRDNRALGRFSLRRGTETVAVGIVHSLITFKHLGIQQTIIGADSNADDTNTTENTNGTSSTTQQATLPSTT